jgi:HK97 family phage portal protein
MALFDRLEAAGQRLIWGETKAAPAPRAANLVPIGVQGRPQYPDTDPKSLQLAYTRNEIVYAAIQRRATSAVGPRLRIEQRTSAKGEWSETEGHPLRRLLMRPNPSMDESAFLKSIIVSLDVAGEFYAEKVRSPAGAIVALHPLDPAKTFPVPGAEGVTDYEFRDGTTIVRIPAANVLVRREWNLASRWHGLSPLAVCLGSVDADMAQTDYIRAFFNNAGVPSGVLKVKGTYTQEQADMLRGKWREKYGRLWGKQHDVAVLDDNAEYQQLGSGLETLDSQTLRSFTESRVCMVFDVPPLIIYAYVGLLRATYSNLKEAWAGFWDATLTPLYSEIASWLLWDLLPEFEDAERIYSERVRLSWDLSTVPWLQEDVTAMQERARANFQAGALTLNEFREAIGQKPDAFGDYYIRKLIDVPTLRDTAVALPEPPRTTISEAAPPADATPPKQLPAGHIIDVKAAPQQAHIAGKIEPRVRAYLRAQYDRAATAAGKKAATDGLDDGTEIAALLRQYYPLLLELAATDAQNALGVDLAFDLNNPAILRTLNTLAQKVRGVAETTKDEIRQLVGQATQEGWSPADLASAIRAHGVTASATRAMVISRTEAASAYTQGSLLAYEQSGVVAGTTWLVADPCPICAAYDGHTAALGATFEGGLSGPPAHPNCKCALAPALKGQTDA